MKPFRYIGRTDKPDHCDDCDVKKILRVYETTSGYLYLCPDCGRQMEDEYENEHKQSHGNLYVGYQMEDIMGNKTNEELEKEYRENQEKLDYLLDKANDALFENEKFSKIMLEMDALSKLNDEIFAKLMH